MNDNHLAIIYNCLAVLSSLATSIWVYFDAQRIGIKKSTGAKTGKLSVDMGPFEWAVCCMILWIVAFPLYLVMRPGCKRRFGSQVPPLPMLASTPRALQDFEKELRTLAKLKEDGIISVQDFEQKKMVILKL